MMPILTSLIPAIVQKGTKSGHFDHWDAIAVILGGLTVMVAMWRIVL